MKITNRILLIGFIAASVWMLAMTIGLKISSNHNAGNPDRTVELKELFD